MTEQTPADGLPRTAIFGSCVTRDVFGAHPELGKPSAYFARSSVISAMHPVRIGDVSTAALSSNFQRRMVDNDLTKAVQRFVSRPDAFDLLLVDLIDERFQVLNTAAGAWLTRSTELTRLDISALTIRRRVAPHSPEHLEAWVGGWHRFVELLRDAGNLPKVRINAVRWSESVSQGGSFPAPYTAELIDRANASLESMYDVMRADLEADQIWRFGPETLVADPEHKWTVAPFHYVPEYYDALADRLRVERPAPGAQYS